MHELKSGLFFFGLSLCVLWESFQLELGTLKEPGAGFLSLCAGLALAALSLVLVIRGWKVREAEKPFSGRVILALVSLFAYSFVLDRLGFVIASFFLVGVLLRVGQPRPWWLLVGVSALTAFLSYLIFGVFLHVYFPRGFIGI